ncbi:MAG: phosphoenolpyruvate synthase [Anaerolineae bacterium]|nr:phosphoenolpyruvate synthase [Anaerolineales bacterium]MCQ3980013.1 phosphoenolpyruvate synthase [Anaerolineae bacterium]
MPIPTSPPSKILDLTLTLSNYPILAKKIRAQMRQELFVKGIITPTMLEDEVERKAIDTQRQEGLTDPLHQETEEIWQKRLSRVRDNLTDFYFAYNLPFSRFEEIVKAAVNENRVGQPHKVILTFNPELAPWYMLFEQAEKYTNYPPEMFESVKHHVREIIVVLLKSLVSDQLAFVRIARNFVNIFDLKEIMARKIGRGKIGGKSAGMILAYKILCQPDPEDVIDLKEHVTLPETYFIGSDVYYDFKTVNNFEQTTSQKYLTREEIERQYPRIRAAYLAGRFPEDATQRLREMLAEIGQSPIIVRSSSLLEDNFGSAFAGKYDSFFLPNQGNPEENLAALIRAVIQIYASILSPDALFYRQIQELDDYDERMAILIQKVQGERYGKYFFPYIAGVGYSSNPFIWNKKLKREDGFLRIVLGMGTRAVDRVDRDYPRMVGLSHPQLRPVSGPADIIKYSQRFMDVIDLEENAFKTIPVSEILSSSFPGVQYLASVDEGDFVKPIFSLGTAIPPEKMVLTFDNLLKNTDFVKLMKTILKKLDRYYERPIDIEFAVQFIPGYPKPDFKIFLLQCRPLSNHNWAQNISLPRDVAVADQIFTANRLVPSGVVDKIKYIVYVDPLAYSQLSDTSVRMEIARIVGRLNKRLEGEKFILMGPGRWGSSNIDLGVKVTYADIYNTSMLIEIAVARNGLTPELSYGTHFFQDLVESNIYPLALFPDNPDILFNYNFINQSPNKLALLLPQDGLYADYIKVVNVAEVCPHKLLRVVMSAEESMALGYLHTY